MTISIMVFLFAASVMAAAAAWTAERGLRMAGLPARLPWMAALSAGPALLGVYALLPGSGPVPGTSGVPAGLVIQLPGVEPSGGVGVGVPWNGVATVLWVLATLTVLVVLLRGHLALRNARRRWRSERVLGHSVFVSEALGPAVAGVIRPRTILPAWALDLPEPQLRLILEHEREHVRARDPQWLAAGLAVVGATAWNPVAWWALRRMRDAIEIDCDRRVLARTPGTRTYGESLLAVAARMPRSSLALAAFTESSRALERRLIAMTTRVSRRTRITGGSLVVVAALLALQACGIESPLSDGAPSGVVAPSAETVPSGVGDDSSFLPFTDPPQLANREDAIAAIAREYPPLLKDAGIEGIARVYMHVTETGEVADVRIDRSAGHEALDQAALRAARAYRFVPARDGDRPVAVWVSLPVAFRLGA